MIPDDCLIAWRPTVWVDDEPFIIDVLAYHPQQRRYLAVVVRKGPYKAGYGLHAHFLAEVVDRHLAGPDDQQTLALVVCDAIPNPKMMFYSIEGIRRPIGVVASRSATR